MTRAQEKEFDELMKRTANDSRYAAARAAFELGLRLGRIFDVARLVAPPIVTDAVGTTGCKATTSKRNT